MASKKNLLEDAWNPGKEILNLTTSDNILWGSGQLERGELYEMPAHYEKSLNLETAGLHERSIEVAGQIERGSILEAAGQFERSPVMEAAGLFERGEDIVMETQFSPKETELKHKLSFF